MWPGTLGDNLDNDANRKIHSTDVPVAWENYATTAVIGFVFAGGILWYCLCVHGGPDGTLRFCGAAGLRPAEQE
jgi:hypothetical protein